MTGRLEGKVALITGAGSGMGREACAVFASEGARVAAVDIDPELLEGTEAGVRATDGEIASFVADVAVEDQVREAVEGAAERFARSTSCTTTRASCGAIATCPSSRPTRRSGIACSRSTSRGWSGSANTGSRT